MKRISCFFALALVGGALLWFLGCFAKADSTIKFVTWTSAEKIAPDGTAEDYPLGEEADFPSEGELYRFTGNIAQGHTGELFLELSGMEATVELDGERYLDASFVPPQDSWIMPAVSIPLPEDWSGTLSVTCRILDPQNIMFPPYARFATVGLDEKALLAYANHYSLLTGASALAAVLAAWLFILSMVRGRAEFGLIALFCAAALTSVHWISVGMGHDFLPDYVVRILSWDGLEMATLLLIALYIALNRRKAFLKPFFLLTGISAAALCVWYLISAFTVGRMSGFVDSQVEGLFGGGYFSGILYYLTFVLMLICTAAGAYETISEFSEEKTQRQALALKNELIMEGYHAMEQKLRADAEARHEFSHNVTALWSLWQSGDSEALGNMINELKQQNAALSRTQFTENFTINVILQDAASRAAKAGVDFEAQVRAAEPGIPEADLCRLLMNMLDNALESAESSQDKRFVRFRAEERNGFLAVKCENSFSHELLRDKNGRLVSTKADGQHGLGVRLMSETAERYGSILDISAADGVFTVQTALKLPENK